jgi:negative regulator of sigma E activity
LAENARDLSSMSNASVATNEIHKMPRVLLAHWRRSVSRLNAAASAFSEVATTVKSTGGNQGQLKTATEQYYGELNKATEGLKSVTAMYKSEFADTSSVQKYFEAYMKNMKQLLKVRLRVLQRWKKFQTQLTELNSNVGALNRVYGSMLSAMKQVNQG